jgi:hypothetical protein
MSGIATQLRKARDPEAYRRDVETGIERALQHAHKMQQAGKLTATEARSFGKFAISQLAEDMTMDEYV